VAEMMNFPGVIAGVPDVLARLDLSDHVDGHAPGVTGLALNAYVASGIRSDHEAFSYEEALEKRRRGMWVLIREASNAHNLRDLLPLVRDYGAAHCAFCTDDREPDLLYREGHIDQMCRIAVSEGIAPEDALLLATLHPARAHGLLDRGAVAPGLRADLVLLDELETFRPARVYKDGRLVAQGGAPEPFAARPIPESVRRTMRSAPVAADGFAIRAESSLVRVIEIVPGQLITHAREEEPVVRDGLVVADPDGDVAKIAVVERHHETGRVGKGLVRGFGLREGAFASTVAHDAHNVVIVGVTDEDMAACLARLQELGGGIVVSRGGAVRGELPLPVAGLLSDQPVEAVVERLEELQDLLRDQGVRDAAPFMTLSFLALSVIPSLKITDRGLVDVERFELVPFAV
jgi:adenine deaminase